MNYICTINLRYQFQPMSRSHINLFTTYYDEINEARKKEYLKAILFNIQNPLIQKIYFLQERNCEVPFKSEKIESIFISTFLHKAKSL